MSIIDCITNQPAILMEGALGERLKREYRLSFHPQLAMARLVYSGSGRAALRALWQEYLDIARRYGLPFLATTPTRRANQERVALAGDTEAVIADNVNLLREVQQSSGVEMYVGGLMGCKGDAYTGAGALSQAQARAFHAWQANLFCKAGVDFMYAGIMPTLPEATGMAQAMSDTGVPYIISFTIQKDGTLIDKTPIAEAIDFIDRTVGTKPLCYMTNCVHPRIVYAALSQPMNDTPAVKRRFLGIQANTSPLSYAELDGCADLQCSDPAALADELLRLRDISQIKLFGGCCGTDGRHLEQLAARL